MLVRAGSSSTASAATIIVLGLPIVGRRKCAKGAPTKPPTADAAAKSPIWDELHVLIVEGQFAALLTLVTLHVAVTQVAFCQLQDPWGAEEQPPAPLYWAHSTKWLTK